MTNYHAYSISLSDKQKINLANAIRSKQAITLRLKNSQLIGTDQMFLTSNQIKKIKNCISKKCGMDLKISKTQIRKSIQHGGSLFSSLINLGAKILPKVIPIASKNLPGLASGALSSIGNFSMDKILGKGQSGGFMIPQNKIDKLIAFKHLLSKKQKEEILSAMQNGGNLIIKPTIKQKQNGGFLGLLTSIAIPMLVDTFLKGKGLQNRHITAKGLQNRPQPYIGSWNDYIGRGKGKTKKKQKKTTKTGAGLILGPNSPFKNIPLLGTIL